ncbi:6-aminohexanoate hydrolase [Neisseria bergeri]|uniref:6-aminohexanoate hydrolase n=1 Tax=Neisseria bergeri TaxID=1906581 RepID=UPI0027E1EA21|nr:6-aminohexanoate hydrolase [Neisseria bergeri]
MDELFKWAVRILAAVADWILELMCSAFPFAEPSRFFHRTARIVVPVLSLGLFRVEDYGNTECLDWRTFSADMGESIGGWFWFAFLLAFSVWAAYALL